MSTSSTKKGETLLDTVDNLCAMQADMFVVRHEASGAPFLIAYGTTFLATAILSFFIPQQTAAMIAMFQGGLALPVAFWLERRMGSGRMAPDNPLRSLSVQMAMSQALGLPILILVYSLNPRGIPLALASLLPGKKGRARGICSGSMK